MTREGLKRGLSAFSLFILLIAFQNCGPAWRTLDSDALAENSLSPTTDAIPSMDPQLPGPAEKTISASETQPLSVNIRSSEMLSASLLPAGASYDADHGLFLWLPKVGQAGVQTIAFKTAEGTVALKLNLQISALTSAERAAGPRDGASDGDVGFIFIHGLGEIDRCANPADLAMYWGFGPTRLARGSKATVLCYDGRLSAETVAPQIAKKILAADCGRFNRCILVTHSMGGLVAEFMMTHARGAKSGDPEPALFSNADLFAAVKSRTLSVISLASAAGGSKVADIAVGSPSSAFSLFASQITDWMGRDTPSVRSVQVLRASLILAPLNEDPGVPVYMVPGFSPQTAWEWDPWSGGLYGAVTSDIPLQVFQGDTSLTGLDGVMQTKARSDGLIDFRSGCGLRSADANGGPGYSSSLLAQLLYCAKWEKKPNHFVWFASNLNHFLIPKDWAGCANTDAPCQSFDFDVSNQTLTVNPSRNGWSAVRVARAKLDENRRPEVAETVTIPDKATSSGLLSGL